MSRAFGAAEPSAAGKRRAAADGMAKWLSLAAAPTFVAMALVTASPLAGPMRMTCSAGTGSALGGMAPMYLLMSAFHLPPWLTLISRRCGSAMLSSRHAPADDFEPPTRSYL